MPCKVEGSKDNLVDADIWHIWHDPDCGLIIASSAHSWGGRTFAASETTNQHWDFIRTRVDLQSLFKVYNRTKKCRTWMWRAKVWKDNRGDSNKPGPTSLKCGKIQQLAGILDINIWFLISDHIPEDSDSNDSSKVPRSPSFPSPTLVTWSWQDILGDEKWRKSHSSTSPTAQDATEKRAAIGQRNTKEWIGMLRNNVPYCGSGCREATWIWMIFCIFWCFAWPSLNATSVSVVYWCLRCFFTSGKRGAKLEKRFGHLYFKSGQAGKHRQAHVCETYESPGQ